MQRAATTDRVVVRGDFQGTALQIGADFADVSYLDVDGAFAQDADGKHDAGACTGIDIGKTSGVIVGNCEIHDVADDGVSITDATSVSFSDNVVHALHACGTDGDCGPCYNGHSDGIEAYHVSRISTGQWTESEHDIVAPDPRFTAIPDADGAAVKDPKPEDFVLEADSMCVGKGATDSALPLPSRDFFNRLRDDMPDIGAIERQ